jgi:branched-chain amino acid transport system ATP-binding protein
VLECEGLAVGYDRLTVARDISLSLEPGEILAVLGPNGAGKTTLLLTLAGFLAPMAGTVHLDGDVARTGSPRAMNRAGVVLVPDSRALFTQLTIAETLRLAGGSRGAQVDEIYDLFPALRGRARLRAGMLSGGEQQMLALARGLIQRPRVLLVDEMSMGLAPLIVESLMPTLRRVADETGAAIVLVEQHVGLALEVANHAMVLVHGDVTLSGRAEEIRKDSGALDSAYLGTVSA